MLRKKKLTPKEQRKKNIRLIVKANQLVEAKYMFDIWETRFFLSLVASISPSDEDDKVYRIWYRDIKNNFEIKTKQSYDLLRSAANRLFDKSLVVGYIKDGVEREQKHRLIIGVDYIKDSEENKLKDLSNQEYIDVKIDSSIRPYLLDFRKHFDPAKDRYTSYELRNVIHLNPYGVRIYELLKQYEKIGHRTIPVDTLKDYFNITNEYPRFANFYHMVIKRSIIEVNKKTDITVPIDEIEKIKKGRKVYALGFPIRSKSKATVQKLRKEDESSGSVISSEIEEPEIIDPMISVEEERAAEDVLFEAFENVVIRSFGVTPSTFLKELAKNTYSKAQIEQAISVTIRAKNNGEIKKNPAGFFLKALREGYTDVKEEAKKKKAEKEKIIRRKIELLETKKSKQINDKIRELVQTNPSITNQAIQRINDNPLLSSLLSEKEESLGRRLEVEDYRQDEQLRNFVKRNIIELSKDDFWEIMSAYGRQISKLKKEI